MIRNYTSCAVALVGGFVPALTSCTPEEQYFFSANEVPSPDTGLPDEDDGDDAGMADDETDGDVEERGFSVVIGGESFALALADNESAVAFAELLPMTVVMNEFNGNEKYYNLSHPLPVDSHRPGRVEAGDIMLYGSNCIVIFYESFSTGYSYTRLGRIDNAAGLKRALGKGDVTVTFDKK